MKTLDLVITLLDDCVFSERNATEGAHRGLDYIAGGALLGAVAAQLYKQLGNKRAFDWFHSGKMRFGNAYPLADGKRTFPLPACWHQAKGKTPISENRLDNNKIWRLDKCKNNALANNEQPQQLRTGYLSLDGQVADVKKSLRLKTAIDSETGRAKEAALFGYDALQAGQQFHAQIQYDDGFTDAEIQQLKAVFSKPILLGRSRSAEYGRARVKVIKAQPPLSNPQTEDKQITLWLLSDLMVFDEYGQPNLAPRPDHLGLPKGELLTKNSFLRTRRYSTWNAHKKSYEMERQVISKGSVLVFKLESPLTAEQLQRIASGLGVERQAGLGQVWLNPPILADEKPLFEKVVIPLIEAAQQDKPIEPPKPDLIKWLESQQQQTRSKQEFAREAREIARGYPALLQNARYLKGLEDSVHIGPSHSQWGAVLAAAKSSRELGIFMSATDGPFKPKGEGWKDELWQNGQLISFYNWFRNHYQQQSSPQFIQYLVREIMAELTDQRRIMAELKDQQGGRA